ncbi:MAG: N-acetylmuramoyl-L-alanine amidase [Candidatus Galacturonibacter soehngenii]|nr:N-acetylmuramoyl-L-alanine amidase [Candidatus Galacturonibacter soehngenii]
MRLMKKALAISLVTALTFTNFELPVRATEYLNTQTEQESTNQTEVQEDTTDESKEITVDNQETVEETTDESKKTQDTDGSDETEKEVPDESTSTDTPPTTDNSAEKEEAESKEEISETQKLFNNALLENGTITLDKDLQIEEMIELKLPTDMEQTSINLELNGYKISSKEAVATIQVGEGVTLTVKGEGSIVNEKEKGIVIYNEGTIKLDHADLLATGSKSVGVLNNSTLGEKGLIIKSGTIKAEWFAIGRTAKAEVSINRPTAFFAAAGIVMPSDKEEIEQGSYSVDDNATVLENSPNHIEVLEQESQVDDSVKDDDTKENSTDDSSTDKATDVTEKDDVQQVPNTSNDPSAQTSQPTTTVPAQQASVVAPEIPTNVSVSVNNYNSIKITWSTASGAKGYIVERIQTDTNTVLELTKTTATSYDDTNNIIVGKEYRYRVYAYTTDDAGTVYKSAPSSEVAVKTTIDNPQNLTATQSSATSIKLTWSGVEGATDYKIYRAAKNGAYKLIETTTSTSYKDSSLKKGTKYSYKVTAVSGDYESGDSNKATLYAAAAGVTKLKASSSAYNKIDLSWKKASGATKYVVYRSTKEGSGYKKVKTVTSNKYSDTVKTGVTYYYKIVSYTDKAKGGESAVISGIALSPAPTNVKAVNNAYNSAKISWSKSKGAGNYAIYRSTSKKSGYTLIKTVSKSKTSYTDKTVEAGTTYYYKVCAVTKGKEGKMSKVVSAKIKPAAVKNLKAKSAGGKNITISWSASKGASSYQIYRSTREKSGYSQIGTTTSLSYTNKKLKNGTKYYYRVYAVAGKIKSDYKQVSYVNPSKVYLSSSTLNLESGETAKLNVSFNPSSVSDATVTWSSANNKIATVSSKGVITALSAGITTITVTTINGLTATCEVGVDQEESGVVVVLDPGHGGKDPGKTYGRLKESEMNLKISYYTKAELEKYSGIIVKMTRTDDTYLDLDERTTIAKRYGADMFISQHNNSADSSSANGAEVYVTLDGRFNAQSTKLGAQILNRLTGLGLNNRGVKTRRGDNGDYYGVIRTSVNKGFPGIIVESAFLSNAEDREILSTELGLKSIGVATATAIAEYYNLTKK